MDKDPYYPSARALHRRVALAASGFVLVLASLCFAAFLLKATSIAGVFPKGIPMAPATAGCFALLAFVLLLWQSSLTWKGRAVRAAAVLVLLVSAAVLLERLQPGGQAGDIPLWKMSPFTAGLFMISAAGLLRVARFKTGPDPASLAASTVLMALSSLILIGYLYGSPFFYGGSIIPVAFTTGLAFLALSAALFASDTESLLATPFCGESLKAVLLRNFLPLTVGAVLLDGLLGLGGFALFGSRPALTALYAILAMAAAAWVVNHVSNRVGDTVARAQVELEKANSDLAERKQDMEHLLYVTTHDLRGPLINIHGFARNLSEDFEKLRETLKPVPLPEETRTAVNELAGGSIHAALNFILESERSMNQVINTLLKVSRLGQVEMRPEVLDADAVLKNVADTLRYQLKEAGCEIKAGGLPPCKADAGALSHIFTNLLSNAVKYRDKSRKLQITVRGELSGGVARYSVADNGLGIKESDLPSIWQFFFSGDIRDVEKGEGIGLPMIKRMVQKNSGRIWAESKEGEGSTFFVELPSE